jgi:hypothetical protein
MSHFEVKKLLIFGCAPDDFTDAFFCCSFLLGPTFGFSFSTRCILLGTCGASSFLNGNIFNEWARS